LLIGGVTTPKLFVSASGNVGIGTTTPNATLAVNGNTNITGSFTVVTGSVVELQVTNLGVNIGNVVTDTHNVTGSFRVSGSAAINGNTNITGSLVVTSAVTASAVFISGSGTQRLRVIGSGSAQPLFTVEGSQGELFSITDSLSGSLFSVSDISGLPILEVFSDDTVLLGDYLAPALHTTKKLTFNTCSNVIYSFPTASYDSVHMEYNVKSGSNGRAGTFTALYVGSSVQFTDASTLSVGSTTNVKFEAFISGANLVVTGSVPTNTWTAKMILRAI
jgi:hypothetical protein